MNALLNLDHLSPHELCAHPDVETTLDGALHCSRCSKVFSHSQLVNEMEPPTVAKSRFAYLPGETEYEYYIRNFPHYDPRD